MVEEITIAQDPVEIVNNSEKENKNPNIISETDSITERVAAAELHNNRDEPRADEVIPDEVTKLPEEPKRKAGRPVGAKSKQPGKPRKPRAKKVEIVEEPVFQDIEEVPVHEVPVYETPRVPSQRIPTEATNDHEAKMLRLLKDHSMNRRQRKVAMWKSWFQ